MKYEIGDKVELKNGCVVTITDILSNMDNIPVYGTSKGHSEVFPITEDKIVRKIED